MPSKFFMVQPVVTAGAGAATLTSRRTFAGSDLPLTLCASSASGDQNINSNINSNASNASNIKFNVETPAAALPLIAATKSTPTTSTTTTTTTPQTKSSFAAAKPKPVTTTKTWTTLPAAATTMIPTPPPPTTETENTNGVTPSDDTTDAATAEKALSGQLLLMQQEQQEQQQQQQQLLRRFVKASGPLQFTSSSAVATSTAIYDISPGPCWVRLPLPSLTTDGRNASSSSSSSDSSGGDSSSHHNSSTRWWPCLAFDDLHDACQMLSFVYDGPGPEMDGKNNNNNNDTMKVLKQQIAARILEDICSGGCNNDRTTGSSSAVRAVVPLVGKFQAPDSIIFLDDQNSDKIDNRNVEIKRFQDSDFIFFVTQQVKCSYNSNDKAFMDAFKELSRLIKVVTKTDATTTTTNKTNTQHNKLKRRRRQEQEASDDSGTNSSHTFRPTKFQKYDSSPFQNHLERTTAARTASTTTTTVSHTSNPTTRALVHDNAATEQRSTAAAGAAASTTSSSSRPQAGKFRVAQQSTVIQLPAPSGITSVRTASSTAAASSTFSAMAEPRASFNTTAHREHRSKGRFKLGRSMMTHQRMVGGMHSKHRAGMTSNLKHPPTGPATTTTTTTTSSTAPHQQAKSHTASATESSQASNASSSSGHDRAVTKPQQEFVATIPLVARQRSNTESHAGIPQGDSSDRISKKTSRQLWKDTGKTIEVPAWVTIKKLLEQMGHVFGKNMFCRPFGNPMKYPDAVKGEDYFTSFTEYRAYLCVNGVDYAGAVPWDDGAEEISMIQSWVRSTVISAARADMSAVRLRDLYLSRTNALKLLKMIDVKWRNGSLKSGYVLPGDQQRNCLEETELWEHLIKSGIPSECELDSIDADDRLALELCMSQGEVFDWVSERLKLFRKHTERQCIDTRKATATIRDYSFDESGSQQSTPAADKAALEASTRAPEDGESPHPSLKSVTRELLKDTPYAKHISLETLSESKADTQEDKDHVDSTGTKQPLSAKHPHKNDVLSREGDKKSNITLTTSAHEDSDDESLQVKEFDVVVPGKTVRQKLRNCLSAMKKDHTDKIVQTSKLTSSLSKIRKFLKTVVQSKGRQGGNDARPILYICGSPGTGKTMSTRQLCDDVIKAHEAKLEDWEEAPTSCYLNCSQIQNFSKKDAMDKILQLMKVPNKSRLVRPSDEAKGHAKILILDEIDQLCGPSGTENCLRTLIEWASDTKNQLCVIGISNSVQDAKSRRLVDLGMSGNRVVFNTYRKEELVKITESKIGFLVFDKPAMEFIAAKVSASSGDARRYLELVCLTIERCLEKLPPARLDSDLTKPVVTIRDAMMAIRETNVKYKDIIESLPFLDKVTLCTGVYLSRRLGSRPVTLRELMHLTIECGGVEIDAGPEEFKESIERLSDSGLLTLDNGDKRSFASSVGVAQGNQPVRFDLQLEDVESALEEFIKSQSFFQRLVERVQAIQC